MIPMGSKYVNSRERCIVCYDNMQEGNKDNPIIKHHIRYYPELVAYVHYKCHGKIHDPDKPIEALIQYTRQESMKFYREKKNAD